jgi:hypothetical protein
MTHAPMSDFVACSRPSVIARRIARSVMPRMAAAWQLPTCSERGSGSAGRVTLVRWLRNSPCSARSTPLCGSPSRPRRVPGPAHAGRSLTGLVGLALQPRHTMSWQDQDRPVTVNVLRRMMDQFGHHVRRFQSTSPDTSACAQATQRHAAHALSGRGSRPERKQVPLRLVVIRIHSVHRTRWWIGKKSCFWHCRKPLKPSQSANKDQIRHHLRATDSP